MKTVGPGGRGLRFGCILISWGRRFPFLRLQGAQEATMFSQTDSPPRLRGMTWSTVRLGLLEPQYWQVQPSRARTAFRVILLPVDVAGDAHEADQADHLGPVDAHGLGAEHVVAALEHLRLLLEEQDQRPAHGADVERLVARVQDQNPPAGQAAGGVYRYLAVGLPVRGGVVAVQMAVAVAVDRAGGVAVSTAPRRGVCMRGRPKHRGRLYGGPVAHIPRVARITRLEAKMT